MPGQPLLGDRKKARARPAGRRGVPLERLTGYDLLVSQMTLATRLQYLRPAATVRRLAGGGGGYGGSGGVTSSRRRAFSRFVGRARAFFPAPQRLPADHLWPPPPPLLGSYFILPFGTRARRRCARSSRTKM